MSIPDWVRRDPTIWVTDVEGIDPRIPTGACVVTVQHLEGVLAGAPLPSDLGFAWFQGATVRWAPDASSSVTQMGAKLEAHLAALQPAQIATLAAARGLVKTAAALREWTPQSTITRTALASRATDESPDGAALLGTEARLLLALDYL